MNLFIDTISSPACIIFFNTQRDITYQEFFEVKGNESSTLIPKIEETLQQQKYTYNDIENIVVVNGPGSFTGVRTTVLIVNTINYIIHKKMTPISYFELFPGYPIIKTSSKRDYFFQKDSKSTISIIPNEELALLISKENIKKIYGECSLNVLGGVKILDKVDYASIIRKISFKDLQKIDPLYIKKPNIT